MPGTFSKLGLVIIFATFVMTLALFLFLPEEIPVHFSGSSVAWSDKWSVLGIGALFAIPTLSIILCGFIYLLIPTLRRIAEETKQPFPKSVDKLVPSIAIFLLIIQILIVGLMLVNI